MKIAVLISSASHPRSGRIIASPLDLKACSLALQLRQSDTDIRFIHFGDSSQAMKDYLAYGIGAIDCYSADEHFDTAAAADKLSDLDLLITGRKAMRGFASGIFSYQLAKILQRPLHSNIVTIEHNDGGLKAEQYLPAGYRRNIEISLPAVISIHEAASSQLNFSYLDQRSGNIIEHKDPRLTASKPQEHNWQTRSAKRLRTRLKIKNTQGNPGGDERMQQALSMGTAGGGSIQRLSSAETAESIWNLLQERKLVD